MNPQTIFVQAHIQTSNQCQSSHQKTSPPNMSERERIPCPAWCVPLESTGKRRRDPSPEFRPRVNASGELRHEVDHSRLVQRVRLLQSERDHAVTEILRLRSINAEQARRISWLSMGDARQASQAGMIGYLTGHVAASQEHMSRLNAMWRHETSTKCVRIPSAPSSVSVSVNPILPLFTATAMAMPDLSRESTRSRTPSGPPAPAYTRIQLSRLQPDPQPYSAM